MFTPFAPFMPVTDPQIIRLLHCIDLEEKEQVKRYSLDQQHTLKSLKAEGLALHPLKVIRKTFGYADYPEISFRLNFPSETNQFRDGSAIDCFYTGEEPVKGILLNLDGRSGDFRLFAPDFPDWIEEEGVGIKLAADQRTTGIMKTVLNNLEANAWLYDLFRKMHRPAKLPSDVLSIQHPFNPVPQPKEGRERVTEKLLSPSASHLNSSQQQAVAAIASGEAITILHGPPGTGKTTTLIEAILLLRESGEKILVTAPSNTAVDNIARGLISRGMKVLRVGNTSKVDAEVFSHTPEGMFSGSKQQKEIKELKVRAEQFRKMALTYKRSFGKSERDQRNLLFKEVKSLRNDIKKLQSYNEQKLYNEAEVILGTPIGLYDTEIKHIKFGTLVMDEAGQCNEPLAWCVFPMAGKYVLAGDHLQLPPTVLSQEAARLGFNRSVLEVCIETFSNVILLDTQYRMREGIAAFSSGYFYNGRLKTASHLAGKANDICFIDTAGSGYNESNGNNGMSFKNEGELRIVLKLIETEGLNINKIAFISPYSGQVAAASDLLPKPIRSITIDSFQGREQDIIILSLVRSNDDGDIGFLKDYRRMNVAITRAREKLYVVGDSATIGGDSFYRAFLEYVEAHGNYRTVWEFEMD